MILTTTNSIENFNVQKYLGVICAQEVIGVNIFSDLVASISDVVGGTSSTYRNHLSKIYDSAFRAIEKQAAIRNANAILGISINIGEVSGKSKQMFMITIIGTAVVIVPVRYLIFKKLSSLNGFKEEGLIDEEEYEYEKKKIMESHTNTIQEETLNEKTRLELEKQMLFRQKQELIEAEKRKKIKAQIEEDKAKRQKFRSIIENLKEEDLANVEYNMDIDVNSNLYENCKILFNKGKCAEAALYYMEETGLSFDDAIDYITILC